MKMHSVTCLLGLSVCCLALTAGAEPAATGAACDATAGQACVAPASASPKTKAEASVASAGALTVTEAGVGTGIENRTLQGAAESFPTGTEKLYCLTKVTGGQAGDTLVHKWSHNGAVVAETTLNVGGSPWRTYSSKTLGTDASGTWSVDVVQNGTVLKHLEATVAK